MLKQWLYGIVGVIADVHSALLQLNNDYALELTDKQLHFLVIGLAGMVLFFLVDPLFRWLIRRGHAIIVSWAYTFTVILGLTFAIEIGQHITHTGNMEFADIVFGVVGFLLMFGVFAALRLFVLGILRLLRGNQAGREQN